MSQFEKKSKLAYSLSSNDQQTHKGFDKKKSFYAISVYTQGNNLPRVLGDYMDLFVSSSSSSKIYLIKIINYKATGTEYVAHKK